MGVLALGIICKGPIPDTTVEHVDEEIIVRFVVRRFNHHTIEIGNTLFIETQKAYTRTTGPMYSTRLRCSCLDALRLDIWRDRFRNKLYAQRDTNKILWFDNDS